MSHMPHACFWFSSRVWWRTIESVNRCFGIFQNFGIFAISAVYLPPTGWLLIFIACWLALKARRRTTTTKMARPMLPRYLLLDNIARFICTTFSFPSCTQEKEEIEFRCFSLKRKDI
uniref:Uncharacterized protein n=1 Tax=Trypanosoma congolense (strain IL3000) TaxID=1068625 RepID=G0V0E9_TRYCI|nr:hypothetical protein, unlikely [Trypanosoma congolense IL3000]